MNNFNKLLLAKPPLRGAHRLKTTQSSADYCLDSIRKYDYENFMCTLLLKGSARSIAVAVRSFNVEVSRVAEQVSQSNIGLMRLKFWEEAVDKCYSKDILQVPKHPVAVELFKAISKVNLSRRYLKTLVSARESNINGLNLKMLDDMEKYAEQTVSSTYYLVLEGCGVKNVDADHAVSHLGKAQGIVQQLRAIPHSKRLDFIPIPEEILIKHHVSQEQVLRAKETQKLSDCVYEVASRAHQHLKKSRNLAGKVPKAGRNALLPAVPVALYLDRLQKLDYNVLDPRLQNRPWKLWPSLYLSMLKNK
ncbi:hypothetical protein HUJ04_002486 [Dendroctonus ponderosae]